MQNLINKAVEILRSGGLVGIPTETVYGLGADARNPEALKKIFAAKQRPIDHPLIVHLADASQLSEWAVDISDSAVILAKHFWPGPLTLILKKAPHVSDLVTGGQDTIGLRVPSHPVAHALLQTFGSGIAAPSANRFGRISPTTAEAVREELGDAVDLVLDGGACEVGVESTIVDVTTDEPVILRPGMITATQISEVLKKSIAAKKKDAPRVSGSLETHYAPVTKTSLVNSKNISAFLQNLKTEDFPVALLIREKLNVPELVETVLMSENPKQYAHDLYHVMRGLDKKKFKQIIIEEVPDDSEWDAIRDRLTRAASSENLKRN